ncbi:ubiquitin carboxyl-terminal hydrolase 2 [Striga asiatica]|uniref:Ubiquitin carboxyl-terminal hydrolase 2 n=1 Tax=Striga asiatica TaxID=4170 RepID=A0A5A7PH46_STRAF|nr:ubiquitin carboxyl-terminal hydrolase 2 [Striga asiatica]
MTWLAARSSLQQGARFQGSSELMKNSGYEWDEELIRQTFNPFEAEKNLKIHISRPGLKDRFVGHWHPTGQLTAKSVYATILSHQYKHLELARTSSGHTKESRMWETTWKLPIARKLHRFGLLKINRNTMKQPEGDQHQLSELWTGSVFQPTSYGSCGRLGMLGSSTSNELKRGYCKHSGVQTQDSVPGGSLAEIGVGQLTFNGVWVCRKNRLYLWNEVLNYAGSKDKATSPSGEVYKSFFPQDHKEIKLSFAR